MERELGKNKNKPLIGITLGDINGIGPEVIIKALSNNKITQHLTPVIYGSAKVLSFYRKQLNNEHFNFTPINDINNPYHRKVNVVNCWEDGVEVNPGQMNDNGGKYAFMALEEATKDLVEGRIHGMVTAPISKHNIQNENFQFPGHTEYLTDKVDAKDSLMLLISETLRVGVVTGHIPLAQVPQSITVEKLEKKLKLLSDTLQNDFGIQKPKIAVLGLNPHAGEEGLLGNEEKEIITPVIEKSKSKGKIVMGPYPADGFFGSGEFRKFDATLAMYHDQGLIPFKSLAFESGVNFTAGLPIVRTSPDHGTAFAIAGKNEANPSSMLAAIYAALDIVNQRMEL